MGDGDRGSNCNFGEDGQGGGGSEQKSEGEKNQPQGDLGKGIPGSEESMCKGPGDSKCKDLVHQCGVRERESRERQC